MGGGVGLGGGLVAASLGNQKVSQKVARQVAAHVNLIHHLQVGPVFLPLSLQLRCAMRSPTHRHATVQTSRVPSGAGHYVPRPCVIAQEAFERSRLRLLPPGRVPSLRLDIAHPEQLALDTSHLTS